MDSYVRSGLWRAGGLGLPLLVVLLLAGCATARKNQFLEFSQAGSGYATAVQALLTEAGAASIDADSAILIKTRAALSAEERKQAILEHNAALRERLALLGDISRHATLLRSYFEALGALAESEAPSGISKTTEGVVQGLGELHPRIEEAKVGEVAVSGFLGKVSTIVVGSFQVAELEDELRVRAPTIARELDLQQAAIRAVAEELRTDLQVEIEQRESQDITLPYVREGALPSEWKKRRRETLTARLQLALADEAAEAAKKLRIAFVALAEGHLSPVDVPAAIRDMEAVRTLVEKARAEGAQEE